MLQPEELGLSSGKLLLVTDELSSPADFVLQQILSTHLKRPGHARCMIVSAYDTLTKLKAIAARSVRLIYVFHISWQL